MNMNNNWILTINNTLKKEALIISPFFLKGLIISINYINFLSI